MVQKVKRRRAIQILRQPRGDEHSSLDDRCDGSSFTLLSKSASDVEEAEPLFGATIGLLAGTFCRTPCGARRDRGKGAVSRMSAFSHLRGIRSFILRVDLRSQRTFYKTFQTRVKIAQNIKLNECLTSISELNASSNQIEWEFHPNLHIEFIKISN
jgi:hypothetical protein